MNKFLLGIVLSAYVLLTDAQCVVNVDFNTWIKGGQPGNGNWVVQNGGSQVHQTINGDPTFFVSPFNLMNVHVSGDFKSTDTDDDYMGFVFSFLNPLTQVDSFDCWLFDWKQAQQNAAPSGMSLDRVNGVVPNALYNTTFWNHQNTPEFTVVQNNFGSGGWPGLLQGFANSHFDLYLTYTRATIFINGNQVFDWQDCFMPGRFGFYNYSQQDCYYKNFQYELFTDFTFPNSGVCLGQPSTFEFVNPCVTTNLSQYQTATWNFGDGGTQVVNNPTLANVNGVHTYTTAGLYTVTFTVLDFNGCTFTSSHQVNAKGPIVLAPSSTNPPCNGAATGSVSVTPSGGFGPYSYSWNGGANTQQTWPGRTAGTYTVTVTDGRCVTTSQLTLNQPTAVTATSSHTNATCGNLDGTTTLVISGGTTPYYGTPIPTAVNWGPGHPTNLVGNTYTSTGFGTGTFIADFRDANGCSATLQYVENITTLPCGLTSNTTSTNPTCFGQNNGTATLTVTGATLPANVTWSSGTTPTVNTVGGVTTFTISNLSPGVCTYNYTDANGAHAFSGTVTILQPGNPVVASLATVPISCPGSNDGQAIASVTSGGVPNYSYNWNPSHANNPVATGLPPGAIAVTVTDSRGCTATANGNVSAVPSLVATTTTIIDSCFHQGKGKATVQVSGGNPPYQYAWNNLFHDTANINIIGGTYTVTVTDNHACTTTASAIVGGPATYLSYTYVRTDVNCFGNSTGAFNISVAGGTPGYNFVWSPNSVSGNNPTGLAAGIYNYTVTDNFGCRMVGGDTILQPAAALTATISHTDVTCFGANNATVTATIAGGTPPYTYLGSPITGGTTVIPNVPLNTYSGNVLDSKGCSVPVTAFTVTQPAAAVAMSKTQVNVACFGLATGSIDITTTGGNAGGYSYLWNDGTTTTEDRNGLVAGTYSVTATDTKGCTASISVTITQPLAALTITETHLPVLCNGGNTGSINMTPAGGTIAYTFLWNDGTTTTEDRNGLTAGTYSVTVTDNALCTATSSPIIITQPLVLAVASSHTNVTCNGANNGSVTVNASGGTTNYAYLWSPNVTIKDTVSGLAANTYNITVTDANGCSASTSQIVTQPLPQSATVTGTNAICFGGTQGTASAVFVNPTGAVNYIWTGGLTGANISTLNAGTYTVTATDANLCTVTGSYIVTEPAAVSLTVVSVNAACFGANGSATATPNGGTAPFNYTWSASTSTTNTASMIAGNFTVTSTDANTCQQTGSGTINQPSAIVIQETAHTNVACFGNSTGASTLTVSGGSGPNYTYVWTSAVSTTNSATGLAANAYTITITDQINCSNTFTVTITQPTAALSATIQRTNVSCFGANDGTVTVTATGGTANYTYGWTPAEPATNAITGLGPNTYDVTITDANSCTTTQTATVTEPTALVLATSKTDLRCNGISTGAITVTATGATSPYSYNWNPTQGNVSTASSLAAGNYIITVTDNSTCSASVSVTLTEPTSLVVSETHLSNLCFGSNNGSITLTVSGATPGYTYQWTSNVSSTNSATNLAVGTYSFTVSDLNLCSFTQSVIITSPQVLSLTLPIASTDVLCFGDVNGTISATATGGTSPLNYSITDGVTSQNSLVGQFSALAANTYTVRVTDVNSCIDSALATINEPAKITDIMSPTDASCYRYSDGQILVTASGGNPGFSYALSNGVQNTTGLFSGLVANTYMVDITDSHNCTTIDSVKVNEPDSVQITVTPDPVEVKLGESLQLQTSNNQQGTVTYNWQPSFGLSCYDCAAPVFSGNYSVKYTVSMSTGAGCTGTSTVDVSVLPLYDVFIPNIFTPNGDGTNDEWKIFGNIPGIKQLNVTVFNRWGEKVFESNDINFAWNGIYKGEFAQPGVYSYVAKFVWLNNHSDNNYKGTLTLIR